MRFRSDPSSIRGSIAPVVTPFAPDGSLDLESIDRLIDWQLGSGTHGISVLGSTGEPTSLTLEERRQVLKRAAARVADRVPFVPGTGSSVLEETLELTAEAEALGADAVLVVAPYYARPTQDGLFQWYGAIAREFPDLPLILYNVPVRAAVDVAPETAARLRRTFDNIVGIKETTRDFEHVSYCLHACGADFLVYSGIELLCLPLLELGGAGYLSCVANIAPGPVARLYEEFSAQRHAEARRLHYALHPLVDLAFVETNPGPVKWVMEQVGVLPCGKVRPPLAEPSAENQHRIRSLARESGLIEGI